MAAKNAFTEALDQVKKLTQRAGGIAGGIANQTGGAINKAVSAPFQPQQFNSPVSNVQAYKPSPVVQNIQRVGRGVSNAIENVPRFNFSNVQTGNPVSNFAVNQVAKPIVQGVLNTPSDFVQGNLRTGREMLRDTTSPFGLFTQPNTQQRLGDAAQVGGALLNVLPVGKAAGVAETLGKQSLKTALKDGSLIGAGYGATQGVLSGLQSNSKGTLKNQLGKSFLEGLQGAAVGGVTGGAFGGASYALGQARSAAIQGLKSIFPKDTEEQLNLKAGKFLRDELGRFAKGGKGKSEPQFYGDLREQLGLSRTGNYQEGFVRIPGFGKPSNSPKGTNIIPQTNDLNPGSLLEAKSPLLSSQSEKGVNQPDLSVSATGEKSPGLLSNTPETQQTGPNKLSTSLTPQDPLDQSISQVQNPNDPYFNVNRLNTSPEAKKTLARVVEEVKPEIERVTGQKLSNEQVVNQANSSSKILHSTVDQQQTLAWEASLLKARQKLAAMADSGTVDQDYIDTLISLKSHATDIGRKLQSFSINADPKLLTSKEAIIGAVSQVEKDSNKILEAAKGVDFNNYKQAATFYRKFIKPTASEKLDLLRYSSMLSSPNTHINNAFSNFANTAVVAPIEKTLTGGFDFLRSKFPGQSPQKQFAVEGPAYLKGYISSLHDASHRFSQVMKDQRPSTNLDTKDIPLATTGVKGKIVDALSIPTKLLEASDQFFTALTQGGEKAGLKVRQNRGVNVGNIETKSADNAAYRLFRSELNDPRQGKLLDGLDGVTGLIQQARSSKNPYLSNIAKYTLPFVKTPMNVLKQMIEYSPAGVATLHGAENKTEQLSKAAIGSSVVLGASLLSQSGRLSWAEPTDDKKKAAFRAAGMQPYSVKIGDKWVSFAKLPPAVSANLALVAAIDDAQKNQRLDDTQIDNILSGVAKWGNFFADQSYAKQIGDLISASKGDSESWGRYLSNYPQQLVPFRALMGWITRITDPTQRKVDPDGNLIQQQIQQLELNIPGLSKNVPVRRGPSGAPIENTDSLINAVSPAKISTENEQGKDTYLGLQQESTARKLKSDQKEKLEKELVPRIRERYPSMTVEQKVQLIKLLKKTGHFNESIKAELRAIEYDSRPQ